MLKGDQKAPKVDEEVLKTDQVASNEAVKGVEEALKGDGKVV